MALKKPTTKPSSKNKKANVKIKRKHSDSFIPMKTKESISTAVKQIKDKDKENMYQLGCLYNAIVKEQWHSEYKGFKAFCSEKLPDFKYESVYDNARTSYKTIKFFGKDALGKYSSNAMRQLSSLSDDQVQQIIDDMKKKADVDKLEPKHFTAEKVRRARDKQFPPCDKGKPSEVSACNSSAKTHNKSHKKPKRNNAFDPFRKKLKRYTGKGSKTSYLAECIKSWLETKEQIKLIKILKKP